jgi:hypothetical protein
MTNRPKKASVQARKERRRASGVTSPPTVHELPLFQPGELANGLSIRPRPEDDKTA